ncbi:MAG: murein biosynthesis integral membrane protein MurJ, partial [Clostridia bacterium]|nr:murein biosynthesis integral membrane protein MurJ [Clostridia bacterium]
MKNRFARTAALMGIIILVSKLMGLVRDVMVAGTYGTTMYAVAYETASRLPVTIFDFVLGGVVTSAFIPVYN